MLYFYEGNSKKSGIYEIRNRISDKSYIGQTNEFKRRWARDWKHHLLNKTCDNKHLQNSFNFYYEQVGHTNFLEFHILEIMENSSQAQREKKEARWIKKYKKNGYKLYNFRENLNFKNRSCYSLNLEETRKKMRLSQKGKHPKKIFENIQLLSPNNELYTRIEGLEDFALKNNLQFTHLREVITEKRKTHKGWRLLKNKDYSVIKTYYTNVISPSGEIFKEIKNLRQFCIENGLQSTNFCRLMSGSYKQHKGWKLLK